MRRYRFYKDGQELFSLISRYVGAVYIADALFREEIADYFNVEKPEDFGLKIAEVELDDVIVAATRSEGSRLSANDVLCMLTARRLGWTCVTNDTRLCRECERENVAYCRGLRLVVELFREGGIDYERARRIGTKIYEKNSWLLKDTLQKFFEMLDEI